MKIEMELRPCLVEDEQMLRGLFHCWENYATVIPPSPCVGGHSGGQYMRTFGIVELENGSVRRVPVESIRFLDRKLQEYSFDYNPQDKGGDKKLHEN